MVKISSSGDYSKTLNFMHRMLDHKLFDDLSRYGELGVSSLEEFTPRETGKTARSWGYRVILNGRKPRIEWFNTDVHEGVMIAILIQYGHATGTGGYVQGRDFINPAMQPIFDQIAEDVWKKVNSG